MNILMVCTGNICRSPLAEGLLRQMLKKRSGARVYIHSAGTHGLDGYPAASFATQAAAEMGVDISGHRARSLDPEMVRQANLILVMEPFHKEIIDRALAPEGREKVRLLADFEKPRRSDSIDDPYQQPLEDYRVCLARIKQCLEGVVYFLQMDEGFGPIP